MPNASIAESLGRIRSSPPYSTRRGVIVEGPHWWGENIGDPYVTYVVDVELESGTARLPRVDESVPAFWYQSGYAHRRIGDIVELTRKGRGQWQIVQDVDVKAQWDAPDSNDNRIIMDTRRYYDHRTDPPIYPDPIIRSIVENSLQFVPPTGILATASYYDLPDNLRTVLPEQFRTFRAQLGLLADPGGASLRFDHAVETQGVEIFPASNLILNKDGVVLHFGSWGGTLSKPILYSPGYFHMTEDNLLLYYQRPRPDSARTAYIRSGLVFDDGGWKIFRSTPNTDYSEINIDRSIEADDDGIELKVSTYDEAESSLDVQSQLLLHTDKAVINWNDSGIPRGIIGIETGEVSMTFFAADGAAQSAVTLTDGAVKIQGGPAAGNHTITITAASITFGRTS